MPINTIQYAALFQGQLDDQVSRVATSSWMEENAGQVVYNGGRDIKIPEMVTQGLGNYNRETGYPRGAVSYAYRTYTMTQDRARQFRLDENDVNETNFGVSAANVLSKFQGDNVIPEIDAYRYMKLANLAGSRSNDTITASNAWSTLYAQLYALADKGVDLENIVVTIAYPIFAMICNDDKVGKRVTEKEIKSGEVTCRIKAIDGAELRPVPSDRLKTAFVIRDGSTSGQEEGGLIAADGAMSINWIICSKSAPIAVSKTDKVKIFTPEQVVDADAYVLDYHKYHDLFLPAQRNKYVHVSTDGAFTPNTDPATDGSTAETLGLSSAPGSHAGLTSISVSPMCNAGNRYLIRCGSGITAPGVGDTITNDYAAWNGTDEIRTTNGDTVVVAEVNADNKVVSRGFVTAAVAALSITSAAGATTGKTALTVNIPKAAGNTYYIKSASNITAPTVGTKIGTGYTEWNGTDDITATTGHDIVLVETDADSTVLATARTAVVSAA